MTFTMSELDSQQKKAMEVDIRERSVSVTGASGSGKTAVLLAHLARSMHEGNGRVLAMTGANVQVLRRLLQQNFAQAELARITVCTPLQFAYMHRQLVPAVRIMDDYEAEQAFLKSAAPLLELEWPALITSDIDPEVSGLRSPDRFLHAAYRLMLKLCASELDPNAVEESALRATTQFYARPPNFADAELLRAIKEEHRSSLRVDREALEHQRKREVDLTRIVAILFKEFAAYCSRIETVTEFGLLKMLSAHLSEVPAQAEIIRRRFTATVIDDAQDILPVELSFLKATFGEHLHGVMMAGDVHATTRSFRGARPQLTLSATDEQYILHERRRGTRQTLIAQVRVFAHPDAPAIPESATDDPRSVQLERCPDPQSQAETIAAYIGQQLVDGVPPGECAVILRTLRCGTPIIEALLAHDIPVDVAGAIDFDCDATTSDYIALLSALAAPETYPEAVLRLLDSKMLRLSDRSIAVLCAPAQDPALFASEAVSQSRDGAKGDRKKQFIDNVMNGVNDHALSGIAVQRLTAFRENSAKWRERMLQGNKRDFLVDVAIESGLLAGDVVRSRFSKNLISRVIQDLVSLADSAKTGSLVETLALWHARQTGAGEDRVYEQIDEGAVCIAATNAVRGRSFTCVAVADARAGAFPRYYVPEAMLYSPLRGFVARENAGSVTQARTAKFTWYFEKTKVRDMYNAEERRVFAYSLARATHRVLVCAWGPATRGRTAPEFLEELRTAAKTR